MKTNQGAEEMIAFTHVNLIPMTSEKVIPDQTVLVKGSEIAAIGASDTVSISRGTQVIDGNGATLMPGLADMQVHTRSDWEDRAVGRWYSAEALAKLIEIPGSTK